MSGGRKSRKKTHHQERNEHNKKKKMARPQKSGIWPMEERRRAARLLRKRKPLPAGEDGSRSGAQNMFVTEKGGKGNSAAGSRFIGEMIPVVGKKQQNHYPFGWRGGKNRIRGVAVSRRILKKKKEGTIKARKKTNQKQSN